jgi:hypothetical protein
VPISVAAFKFKVDKVCTFADAAVSMPETHSDPVHTSHASIWFILA